jgi:hypothetical protein
VNELDRLSTSVSFMSTGIVRLLSSVPVAVSAIATGESFIQVTTIVIVPVFEMSPPASLAR